MTKIAREGPEQGDPGVVHGEIQDSHGDLIADGDSTMVPLTVAMFKNLAGIDQLPEDFARHLEEA